MTLRAVKPRSVQKRFKAFFYGAAKVGKTTAAIQFPKPYLIDTERGAENDKYTHLLEQSGGVIFQTNDFEEVIKEVKQLLTVQHEYKTLIIDPLTTLYNDLIENSSTRYGTDYGKHFNEANKRVKLLYNLLLRLDMNVIVTSHSKNEYGHKMEVIGQTFDCYKKMDYMFDLILEIQKRAKERVALVRGTRLEGFVEDDVFPFSYEQIAARYGKDILEKECQSVTLSTPQQIAELKRLVELLNLPKETVVKLLKKEEVEDFEFLSSDYIQKCIDFYKSKVQGAT